VVNIRLTGLPDQVTATAERIGQVVTVLETSKPYPRRGNSALVSLYLEVAAPAGPAAPPATPATIPPVTGGPAESTGGKKPPPVPGAIPLEVPHEGA
jgi:hypothetical protein